MRKVAIVGAVVVIAVLAVVVLNNGNSTKPPISTPTPTPASNKTAIVQITGNGFVPGTIQVKAGTAVTWTNNDSREHRVAGGASVAGFGSQELGKGSTYTYTFDKSGTYQYADPNQSGFKGTVLVE